MNLLHQLRDVVGIAPHESVDDALLLVTGDLHRFDHAANTGRVHCHRLLSEDMLVLLNGVAQLRWAKSRRRTQQHDVDIGIDYLLICVEAQILAAIGNLHLGTVNAGNPRQ